MMDLNQMLRDQVGDGSREKVEQNLLMIHLLLERHGVDDATIRHVIGSTGLVDSLVEIAQSGADACGGVTLLLHTLWHLSEELDEARVTMIEAKLGRSLADYSRERLEQQQQAFHLALAECSDA